MFVIFMFTPLTAIRPTSPVGTAKCYRKLRKQQFTDLTDSTGYLSLYDWLLLPIMSRGQTLGLISEVLLSYFRKMKDFQ
jgi:hypothetical protein